MNDSKDQKLSSRIQKIVVYSHIIYAKSSLHRTSTTFSFGFRKPRCFSNFSHIRTTISYMQLLQNMTLNYVYEKRECAANNYCIIK